MSVDACGGCGVGVTRGRLVLISSIVVGWILLLCGAAPAVAGPVWRVTSMANTTVQPGGQLTYYLQIKNVGDASSDGSSVNLTVTLPGGMTGVSADTTGFSSVGGYDCSAVAGATGTFMCK